jgi:hypothetical protein
MKNKTKNLGLKYSGFDNVLIKSKLPSLIKFPQSSAPSLNAEGKIIYEHGLNSLERVYESYSTVI